MPATDRARVILVYGYPIRANAIGADKWTVKITEGLDQTSQYVLVKLYHDPIGGKLLRLMYSDLLQAIKGIRITSDIVILADYDQSNVLLWLFLKCLRRKSKIIAVFHHNEHFSEKYRSEYKMSKISKFYYFLLDQGIKVMLRNCQYILTVSNSSQNQLIESYSLQAYSRKIHIIGAGIEPFYVDDVTRDIEFLSVGRFRKFSQIEPIWKLLKEENPNSDIRMIGPATERQVSLSKSLGVSHLGEVDETCKYQLYSRSKVLLHPSIAEGFGIAVAEALYAGLQVVAWEIPVFVELYKNNRNVKLVPIGDVEQFVKEAMICLSHDNQREQNHIYKWPDAQTKILHIVDECLKLD
jgi:glycosyltransferase involved in cell wall biosynthesis